MVHRSCLPIQSNGLKQKLVLRSALHLNGDVIPGIAIGIARYSSRKPRLILIVPDVPFVPARDATFMSPDKRLATDELIDIEFNRLGCGQIGYIEVNIVGEIMQIGNDRVVWIRHSLGRKISDEMVIP